MEISDIITTPHDVFFKESFSDLELVKGFMQFYMPANILKIVDLESIRHEKDSFVEKDLKQFFSDILFSLKINNKNGFMYFLFEHKSYRKEKISLQLLNYMLKIWMQKRFSRRGKKLPIIIPAVIYHGRKKWNIKTGLSHLIEGIDELIEQKKFIPDYEYLIYDLSPYGSEEIKGAGKLYIFLDVLKSIFIDDEKIFLRKFEDAVIALKELDEQETGSEYFETVIRYVRSKC